MFKKKVKCINCGFLGIYSGSPKPHLEISPRDRSDLSLNATVRFMITCLRGQNYLIAGITSPGESITHEALHNGSSIPRYCKYYYPFNPGHTPEQHLELLRERTQRRFLILVSLLSAVVGAVIATLVNLIWS
ncbi:hypothetical protein ACFLXG_00900 [Chloroflexota bacterium]